MPFPSGPRPRRAAGARRAWRRRSALIAVVALGVGVASALPGGGAAAQTTSPAFAIDVGTARIQQAGTAPLTAPSVGLLWNERGARGSWQLAGSAAAGDGRFAALLGGDGSRMFGSGAWPREVVAEARAVRVPNTPWATLVLAGGRQHATWGGPRPSGGAWVGARAGAAWLAGGSAPSAGAEAGVWTGLGGASRAALSATATTARAAQRGLVASGINAGGPLRVTTGDVLVSLSRTTRRAELGAWAGARWFGPRGLRALPPDGADSTALGVPLDRRVVVSAVATVWLTPALGLTASAGDAPNDPTRGAPAARHVAVAIRLRPASRWTWRPPPPRPPSADRAVLWVDAHEAGAAGASPAPNGGSDGDAHASTARTVRVAAPDGAARVELRTEATRWRAVPMTRAASGVWTTSLALESGTHRVLLRVNGGPWRAPANLPAVPDDYEGSVGLLVVP